MATGAESRLPERVRSVSAHTKTVKKQLRLPFMQAEFFCSVPGRFRGGQTPFTVTGAPSTP